MYAWVYECMNEWILVQLYWRSISNNVAGKTKIYIRIFKILIMCEFFFVKNKANEFRPISL